MSLTGSIFKGGPMNSTPACGEMGGFVNIPGAGNYLVSGIFVVRKP